MWQKNLDKLEGQTVRHTYILYTQPYILLVSPPVVAVPRGATIIQPSVVKTESDVMRTVKQPWPSSDTFQQITCHAEAMHKPSHTHTHGGGLALLHSQWFHHDYTRGCVNSTMNLKLPPQSTTKSNHVLQSANEFRLHNSSYRGML